MALKFFDTRRLAATHPDVTLLQYEARYREVDVDSFIAAVGDVELPAEDESLSQLGDSHGYTFHLGLLKGKVVAMASNAGHSDFFTPLGLSPGKLKDFSCDPEMLHRHDKSSFSISHSDYAGLFCFHGTDAESGKDIQAHGVDIDKCEVGHMGKCFYTSSTGKYASSYAVSSESEDATVVVVQLAPDIRILRDGDEDFSRIIEGWGSPDFKTILVEQFGYDAIHIPAYDAIGIYNSEAVEVVGLVSKRDIKEYQASLDNKMSNPGM